MTTELISFGARLVSDAIESPDGLYVRTTDDVFNVDPTGQVSHVHTLDEQSPFGFKGLVTHQGALWTFSQPLVGSSTLTAIGLNGGEVRSYDDVPFRRPDALMSVGGELFVFDQLVPTTEISLFQDGRKQLVAQARNLTHWLIRDDALLWSEDEGIWQWQAGQVTQLVDHSGILTFDEALDFVAQPPVGDGNIMTVNAAGKSLLVETGRLPVALYTLASGTFIRFARELAPVHTPQDRQPLTDREEVGPLLNTAGRLVFLHDSWQLTSSTDGRTWTYEELPVKCTRLIQAGPRSVVGSSRQGAVWVRFST